MSFSDPGAITTVIAGGPLDPAWGNAIRDRVVGHYLTTTDRDAAVVAPKEGMAAYQNTDDQFNLYNGVAWRAPWNMPWGAVGYAQAIVGQAGIGAADTDLTSLAVTWTAVSNRRYRATAYAQFLDNTGACRPLIKITTSANVQLTQGVAQTATAGYLMAVNAVYHANSIVAGSTTWKLRANTATNTIDLQAASTNPAFLLIEDIGPNGVAA